MVVELELEVGTARTLKPQQLPQAACDYLSPRKRQTYYVDSQPPR